MQKDNEHYAMYFFTFILLTLLTKELKADGETFRFPLGTLEIDELFVPPGKACTLLALIQSNRHLFPLWIGENRRIFAETTH